MRKIFQLVAMHFSAQKKTSFRDEDSAKNGDGIKSESRAYLSMPMAFDFTAYFDDKEFENNAEDSTVEYPTTDANNDVFCMNYNQCNEMLNLSICEEFEYCIN